MIGAAFSLRPFSKMLKAMFVESVVSNRQLRKTLVGVCIAMKPRSRCSIWTAAKLQGMVKMVDIIREIILGISDPIGEGSAPDDQVVAGVRFDGKRTAEREPVSNG